MAADIELVLRGLHKKWAAGKLSDADYAAARRHLEGQRTQKASYAEWRSAKIVFAIFVILSVIIGVKSVLFHYAHCEGEKLPGSLVGLRIVGLLDIFRHSRSGP